MPTNFVIDVEERIVRSQVSGVFTTADFVGHREQLLTHPDFDATFRHLIDFSGVTHFDVSSESMVSLARSDPWDSDAKRAVVAPSDVVFGYARMYQIVGTSEANIAVFRRVDEAEVWLRESTP